MDTRERLVRLLADGEWHSGAGLAAQLELTRAGIWKAMQSLAALGLETESCHRRGYRLAEPLELLDANRIRAALGAAASGRLGQLDVHWSLPSTSDHLLQSCAPSSGLAVASLAEYQTRGRGRRGRSWLSAVGGSLCLSLAWPFRRSPASLASLGLVAGVAVVRALHNCGVSVRLKWPNDVILGDRKLAGILVDVRGEAGGPLLAVIGVGLNYRLNHSTFSAVDAAGGLPAAAVIPAAGSMLSRNALAAALLEALLDAMQDFAAQGFRPFASDWEASDYLRGRAVTVHDGEARYSGTVRGLGPDGQLLLDTGNDMLRLLGGEVTVRTQA